MTQPGGISRRGLVGAAATGAVLGLCGCGGEEPASGRAPRPTPTAAAPSASPGPHPSIAPIAATAPATVRLLQREAWGARPATPGGWLDQVPVRLTVHQSAYSATEFERPLQHVRFLQRDHQSRRWIDVSYHYLIDAEGLVYEGRAPGKASETPTPYDPDGHLSVCLLGRFDFEPLPAAQRDAAAATLAWLSQEHAIATDTIAGHHDFAEVTPCPGRAVDRLLRDGSLRARVEGLLAAGSPQVELRS